MARSGYSVLPARGKAPDLLGEWKSKQKRRATEEDIRGWFKKFPPTTPDMRIGLVTGKVSGGIWVLDIDDEAALEWARSCPDVPETTWRVKSPGGWHWYYRYPKAGKRHEPTGADVMDVKSTGIKVDLRGEGGFIVCPPSRNGEGVPYEWEILTGEPTEWSFAESGIGLKLPSTYRLKRPEPGGLDLGAPKGKKPGPAPKPAANLPARREALPPDEVLAVRTDGRFPEDPAERGGRNSALTRYAGLLVSKGVDESTLRFACAGWNMRNREPLPKGEVAATLRSVVKMHERNYGMPIPKTPDAMAAGRVASAVRTPPAETGKAQEEDDGELEEDSVPDGILHPGGLLEEIMDYVVGSEFSCHPLFALGMGVCLIGTLTGEKVLTSTGLRTNMYVITLSRSGTGKEGPMKAARRLLYDTGTAVGNLGPSDFASGPALMKHLELNPNFIFIQDEIGDFVGAVKHAHNPHKTEIMKILKELFSSRGRYDKAYANTKHNFELAWHNVCFYGTGTPDEFWNSLTMKDLSGGFLARALTFSLTLKARLRPDAPPAKEIPYGLASKMTALHETERRFEPDDVYKNNPLPRTVPMTEAAEREMKSYEARYVDLRNGKKENGFLDSIYARAAEHVNKLSLVYAVSRTADGSAATSMPAAVEAEDVLKAAELIDWHIPRFVREVSDRLAYNPQDALRRRIIAVLRDKGVITQEGIYQLTEDCTGRQVEDATNILVHSGDVIARKGRTGWSFVLSAKAKRKYR
jgi:hypothetical protein